MGGGEILLPQLVVHFTINDISFAEKSVDTRMAKEMADGSAAERTGDARQMIRANAGVYIYVCTYGCMYVCMYVYIYICV